MTVPGLSFELSNSIAQALPSEAAQLIAKKERERLKLQDKLRREQLERVREEQNQDAAAGDVRGLAFWVGEGWEGVWQLTEGFYWPAAVACHACMPP